MSRAERFLDTIDFFDRPEADRPSIFPEWPERLPATEVLGPGWELVSARTRAAGDGVVRRWSLRGDGLRILAVLFVGEDRDAVERWFRDTLELTTAPDIPHRKIELVPPLDEILVETDLPPDAVSQPRERSRIWVFRNLGLEVLGSGVFEPGQDDPVARLSQWLAGVAGEAAKAAEEAAGSPQDAEASPSTPAPAASSTAASPPRILDPEVGVLKAGESVVLQIFDPSPGAPKLGDYEVRVRTDGDAFDFVGVEPEGPRLALRKPGEGSVRIDVTDRRTLRTRRIEKHLEVE